MLSGPAWLALEVKDLAAVRPFYEEVLGLQVTDEGPDGGEVAYAAGPTDIVLREPGPVPRGGLHVHYAFSIPPASYDDWWAHLSTDHDLYEHRFGDVTSLYTYDPVGNCVELGQDDSLADESAVGVGPGDVDGSIGGVFEVVLEVEDLYRAEHFYRTLGFEVVDRGDERARVRMHVDGLAIELWEPQLGIADARGGVHVDLGLAAAEPNTLTSRVTSQASAVTDPGRGSRIRDQDGHWITIVPQD
jgi:catechol-2,3-dioxygenase